MSTARSERMTLETARERARVLRLIALVVVVVTLGQLGWLQLVNGESYRDLSESNYVQDDPIHAPRGLILDRNGRTLAENRPAVSITLKRTRDNYDESLAPVLAELLGLEETDVLEKLKEARQRYYGSVPLVEDASLEQISRVRERSWLLPGVHVEAATRRSYRRWSNEQGAGGDSGRVLASHALGYAGEISESELKESKEDSLNNGQDTQEQGYALGAFVGKTGIEKRYEPILKGTEGVRYWVCDASGLRLRPFEDGPNQDAKPGATVVVTIDALAQRAAEEALSNYDAGAIVALEPSTGEVLVMASHPAPDPNTFVDGLTPESWRDLSTGSRHPLLNRCIQATYPPGSQFKLVTAAAGLEEDEVEKLPTVICRGAYKYGIRTFRCWKREGHGATDLLKGITESCDVYFYQLGARLRVDRLMEWAQSFGLGRPTGIDIPGEVGGNVPTPDWYDRRYGEGNWSKGVALNLAIGQGELLVTPLQAAYLVSGIVNDGRFMRPHLFKSAKTGGGRQFSDYPLRAYHLRHEPGTLSFLREAMVNVVEGASGTGKQARIRGIEVGGKTGTAQNPHGEDHSWFVMFAPASDPKIVVAVLVENAGSGAAVAAPIARKVTMAYLGIEEPTPVPAEQWRPGPEGPPVAPEEQSEPDSFVIDAEAIVY